MEGDGGEIVGRRNTRAKGPRKKKKPPRGGSLYLCFHTENSKKVRAAAGESWTAKTGKLVIQRAMVSLRSGRNKLGGGGGKTCETTVTKEGGGKKTAKGGGPNNKNLVKTCR